MAPEDRQNDTFTTSSGGPPAKVPSEKELARKIRKRELDRRAQRQARERTRNRIAELEAQVKELRKDDSTRLSACIDQLATITRERDSLVDAVKSIEQIIRDHVLPSRQTPAAEPVFPAGQSIPLPNPSGVALTRSSSHSDSAPIRLLPGSPSVACPQPLHGSSFGSKPGFVGTVPFHFSPPPSVRASTDTSDSQDLTEELEEDEGNEDHDDTGVIVPPPEAPCECLAAQTLGDRGPRKINLWRAVNQVLTKGGPVSKEAQEAEDSDDEDVPIRVLIEGWDAVAKSRPLSRLWKKLRWTDEILFIRCPPTERLAILRIMHLLLKYHCHPTLERPSQKIPHSYAIDFFVWPGVRERFVFEQHAYCSNQFWYLFASCVRIRWPFEFRDTYRKSVVTGRYQLSPLFDQRLTDLNVWTMENDMFARFPELTADIPSFQPIGHCLTPVATTLTLPQQASLSQLKEREEQLPLEHVAEDGLNQDVVDCTQAMQVFPLGAYSMAPPVFMAEYTPSGFDTNSCDSLPEYF
ncbi:hypothetical protein LZ31DRAFT_509480, partial [Colletotrichum somersetense]